MKKAVLFIVGAILAVSVFLVAVGCYKASLMNQIANDQMQLLADSSTITDFDAKLYEIAYSLPFGSEKVGLWLEALISKKFETFSTQGQVLTPAWAAKLDGWPIEHTIEIDLSGSEATTETLLALGKMREAEWIDLSRTGVDAPTLQTILKRAPKVQKLQLNQTAIKWTPELIDVLIAKPNLATVESDSIKPSELARLNEGLKP